MVSADTAPTKRHVAKNIVIFTHSARKQKIAVISPLTGLKAELAEIDENLIRNEYHYIGYGQVAHAAVKSKKCPYFSVRYNQIARRRGKKKAIIAIAHMLLVCIYHMFSRDEEFNPELYTLHDNQKTGRKSSLTADEASVRKKMCKRE